MRIITSFLSVAGLFLLLQSTVHAEACNTGLIAKPVSERLQAKDFAGAEQLATTALTKSDNRQNNLTLAYVYINAALRSALNLDTSKLGFAEGETGSKKIELEQLTSALSDRYYVDKDYLHKAEKQILQTTKRWPDTNNLYYCLTKLHFYAEDHQRFLQSLHKTLSVNMENEAEAVDFLIGYSANYFKKNRYTEAADVCKTILISFPKSAPALSTLGVAYIYQGYSSRAMKLFEKAYISAPEDIIVIGNIGETAMLMGDIAKARTFIQKRVDMEPQRTELYFDLAILALAKGPDNSLSAWEKYLQQHKIHPDNENWANNARAIKTAIEQGMDDSGLHELSVSMINAHVTKYAIPPLIYLKNKYSNNAVYTYSMAHAYDANKNYELAKISLQETLIRLNYPQSELEVDLNEIHYNMARYQYSLNETDDALVSMDKIDQSKPNYADTGYMYGLIYQKLGMPDKAKAHYTRCKQNAGNPQLKKYCEKSLARF